MNSLTGLSMMLGALGARVEESDVIVATKSVEPLTIILVPGALGMIMPPQHPLQKKM